MTMLQKTALAAATALALTNNAFAQNDSSDEADADAGPAAAPTEADIKRFGLSVGNAYACHEGDAQAEMGDDVQLVFDFLLRDMGSSAAYLFATSAGYGASLPKEEMDCDALVEEWNTVKADFGIGETE